MLGVDRAGHDMVSQGWCETSDSGTGRTMLANVVHWGREQRLGVNSSGAGMLTSGWELLVGSRWCPSRVFSGGITHASKQVRQKVVSITSQLRLTFSSSRREQLVECQSVDPQRTVGVPQHTPHHVGLSLCQMTFVSTSEQRSFFPHSSPKKKTRLSRASEVCVLPLRA
jgi:hypothetical protein